MIFRFFLPLFLTLLHQFFLKMTLDTFTNNQMITKICSLMHNISMRPQYALRDFSLFTMYPTKELEEDKTIEEAGLQSSAIMQRLK